jgi:PAS domain S-box-containing protein
MDDPPFASPTPPDDVNLLGARIADLEGQVTRLEADLQAQTALLESVSDAVIVVDMASHILYWNHGAETLYGWSAMEALGQALADLIGPPGYLNSTTGVSMRADLAQHDCWTGMVAQRHRTGREIFVEASIRVLYNAYHLPQVFVTSSRDVTARVQAEAALRTTQAHERLLFERNVAGICRATLDGQILACNQSYVQMLGYESSDELLDLPASALYVEPVDRAIFLARLLEQGILTNYEVCLRRKDGQLIWVLENVSLVDEGAPNTPYIVGTVVDITARKQAEAALRETEARFRTLVEQLPAITYVAALDTESSTLYTSPQVESLLGFSQAEWLADPIRWFKQVHPDDREQVLADLERIRTNTAPVASEYRMLTRDGRVVWFRDESSLIRSDTGQPLYIQGVMLNITERKRLEAQLLQAQKLESVGRLAGGLAHDFNNALTAIGGYAELIAESLPADDPLRADSEHILQATRRASNLTRQLLAFARKQIIDPQVLNLNDLIRSLNALLHRIIGEDVELVIQYAPDLGQVKADPGQIEQVLINLAVNARDAMPHGGKLIVATHNLLFDAVSAQQYMGMQPGEYVLLEVSDTGVGIDAETQQQIFEPFFTTKEPGKGTGLGLAVSHGIVTQAGGYIGVYSEAGVGATFKIYLPRVAGEAAPALRSAASVPVAGGNETILLAEDEPLVRAVAVQALRAQGYTVLIANTGIAALELARGYRGVIHLVVTDVVMPQMSGTQLVEQLTAVDPSIKVLYMSGYTESTIVHHGMVEPGVTLLLKPFTLSALAHKVREVLDS